MVSISSLLGQTEETAITETIAGPRLVSRGSSRDVSNGGQGGTGHMLLLLLLAAPADLVWVVL